MRQPRQLDSLEAPTASCKPNAGIQEGTVGDGLVSAARQHQGQHVGEALDRRQLLEIRRRPREEGLPQPVASGDVPKHRGFDIDDGGPTPKPGHLERARGFEPRRFAPFGVLMPSRRNQVASRAPSTSAASASSNDSAGTRTVPVESRRSLSVCFFINDSPLSLRS